MRFQKARVLAHYVRTALVEHPRVRLARLAINLWQFDAAHREILQDDRYRNVGRTRREEFWHERGFLTDEIDALRSRLLLAKAYRLDVDMQIAPDD